MLDFFSQLQSRNFCQNLKAVTSLLLLDSCVIPFVNMSTVCHPSSHFHIHTHEWLHIYSCMHNLPEITKLLMFFPNFTMTNQFPFLFCFPLYFVLFYFMLFTFTFVLRPHSDAFWAYSWFSVHRSLLVMLQEPYIEWQELNCISYMQDKASCPLPISLALIFSFWNSFIIQWIIRKEWREMHIIWWAYYSRYQIVIQAQEYLSSVH